MRVIFDLVYYHCGPKANLLNMDKDFVRRDEKEMLKVEDGIFLK
jgi:hypothetical protein